MTDSEWRIPILRKIENLIEDDEELAKIIFYLGQQDEACGGCQNSGVWKMLRDLIETSDRALRAYLQKILQEIERNTQPVRDSMTDVYNQMCLNGSGHKPISKLNMKELTVSGSVGFAYAWSCISVEAQKKILQILPYLVGNVGKEVAEKAIGAVSALGKKASIVLAAVYLGYEALRNIYRWWHGDISGLRVAKNIIDSCVAVSAGFGGSIGGAAVGGLFLGPIGVVVGGVIGGVVTSVGASVLIDKLTQEIFNIPKDEALEKAYRFLGVNRRSTVEEINKAYHSLCRRYHPDKGGSKEKFIELQTYMGIIKVARGEKY